jgi:hypothetical protein
MLKTTGDGAMQMHNARSLSPTRAGSMHGADALASQHVNTAAISLTIYPVDMNYLRAAVKKVTVTVCARNGCTMEYSIRATASSYVAGIENLLRERMVGTPCAAPLSTNFDASSNKYTNDDSGRDEDQVLYNGSAVGVGNELNVGENENAFGSIMGMDSMNASAGVNTARVQKVSTIHKNEMRELRKHINASDARKHRVSIGIETKSDEQRPNSAHLESMFCTNTKSLVSRRAGGMNAGVESGFNTSVGAQKGIDTKSYANVATVRPGWSTQQQQQQGSHSMYKSQLISVAEALKSLKPAVTTSSKPRDALEQQLARLEKQARPHSSMGLYANNMDTSTHGERSSRHVNTANTFARTASDEHSSPMSSKSVRLAADKRDVLVKQGLSSTPTVMFQDDSGSKTCVVKDGTTTSMSAADKYIKSSLAGNLGSKGSASPDSIVSGDGKCRPLEERIGIGVGKPGTISPIHKGEGHSCEEDAPSRAKSHVRMNDEQELSGDAEMDDPGVDGSHLGDSPLDGSRSSKTGRNRGTTSRKESELQCGSSAAGSPSDSLSRPKSGLSAKDSRSHTSSFQLESIKVFGKKKDQTSGVSSNGAGLHVNVSYDSNSRGPAHSMVRMHIYIYIYIYIYI